MSQTIDERVVEMKFDNKQFESGVATTMATLKKFKKNLDFSKIGNSFDNITKAANKVDISGLDQAISGIRDKFSGLEVVAITAIGNITNSILNSAKRWASAFTIDPIISGFQEYETQINAVQTILANTQKEGTNIKQVNAALDELNLYADKTIYNFTEMTRNIGTFTASGVDLKTSVSAIQGIANLAAVSGSNSQQASTAMYQLSQALATGTVKLMDWNSVVNAGMGGQLFQDALKETSRELKTGADAAIEASGSFRESLKFGWLTSEVLTETLKKFTTSGAAEYIAEYTGLSKEAVESELELAKSTYGEADAIDKAAESLAKKSGKNKDEIAETLRFAQTAEDAATKVKTFTQLIDTLKEALQSGWSQSFRIIIGDFEEAKALFTEISDSFGAVIGASADARNKLLTEVFNKKDAEDYMASVVDVPKEAISELETVAKEAGTTSDLFKDTLNVFTDGDKTLNKVMTDLIEMLNSEKDAISYISDVTGIEKNSIKELQNLGKEVGYTSNEFKEFAKVLSKGNPEIEETLVHLLEMNDVLEKPSGRELFIDSLRNSLKGLVSVIKPIQEAFREVFPPATAEQVYGMLEAFNKFTKTLILSEKNSNNLKKAFKGLFDVAKVIRDISVSLLKVIIPIEKPVSSLGDGVLGLAGAFGSLLSFVSNGIRSSKLLSGSFSILQRTSSGLMNVLSSLIKVGITFMEKLSKMEGTVKLINSINNAFKRLYNRASPYIDDFIYEVENLVDSLFGFKEINIDYVLKVVSDAFSDLAWEIDNFTLEDIKEAFDALKSKIEELEDLLMSNEAIQVFVTNFKKYMNELREALTLDNLLDRIEKVMTVFNKFLNWVKKTLAPAFEGFNAGSAIATAGGTGLLYSLIKMANALEIISSPFKDISNSLGSIPKVLGSVKGVLDAYQKDLKADALIKVAKGIAILAGSLVILCFLDTEKLVNASSALSLVSTVLIGGTTAMISAINKGKELNDSLSIFAKGLSSTMKKFGRALEIKAIGSSVKDFAESIVIITLSIIALGVMWRKDPKAFDEAIKTIEGIGLSLAAMVAIMAVISKIIKNPKGLNSIGKTVLTITASLSLVVWSVSKLMKVDLPDDYETKLGILGGIITGLGALAVVLSVAARISGSNELPKMASAIKSLAILMLSTVLSLKILFGIELPNDYQTKLNILSGVFAGLAAIVIAMGVAARISKGQGFKAATTILAMSVFLIAVVGSLYLLMFIDADKMLKGVVGLGAILIALGVSLAGASKITSEGTAKSLIGLAAVLGVLVAALIVLSFIPFENLLKSSLSLGLILIALSKDFEAMSKVQGGKAILTTLAMIASILTISYALIKLSNQPWEGMLAAGAAMSAVLLSFAKAYEMILKPNWSKNTPDKLKSFGMMVIATIPIAAELAILSHQPWGGMLAAATAMSITMISFAKAYEMILKPNWSKNTPDKLKSFGMMVIATIPIAIELGILANQPWEGMLASAASLSTVLIAMSTCLAILTAVHTNVGAATQAALGLSAFIGILGAVMIAIGALFSQDVVPLEAWLDKAIEIMIKLGDGLGQAIGAIVGGLLNGVANSLPAIGDGLSGFMQSLDGFAEGSKSFDEEVLKGVGILAACIVLITAAEVIAGIGTFLGGAVGMISVATNLVMFITTLQPFLDAVEGIKPESMEAVKKLAEMIIILTAAEMISGIGRFLGISGNLSSFGEELSSFAPSIVNFAEQVKDVKPEAVEGAAAAAEIMSNLANKLPGTDGLIQKIFGKKSLAEFGAELVLFGPSIVLFSNIVKNVKPESVQGAAAAAEIMATLADKLPNSGGLAAVIFGDNTLSSFGGELVAFGPNIALFAEQVKGVTPASVIGAASAAGIMSTLANDLPNSETLWNKIFGGGKVSLSEFGTELVSFGVSMTNFSNSVGNINLIQIAGAITSFKNLIDLATYAQNSSASGILNFAYELNNLGTDSVNNFILAFQDGDTKVSAAITGFISSITTAVDSNTETFTLKGKQIVTFIINGIVSKYPEASLTGKNLAVKIIGALQLQYPSFLNAGTTSATEYLKGIKNKYPEAITTGKTLSNNALEGCKAVINGFKEAGSNAGQGFVEGIKSKETDARKAGISLGNAAYEASKKALDEHSPSKKMEKVGDNAGLGFINRLMLYVAKAAKVGKDIADSTYGGISSIITDDIDINPVITPVIDLSNVNNAIGEIRSMFNDAIKEATSLAINVSSNISSKNGVAENIVKSNEGKPQTIINYEQNNYSPKALSNTDIYRQTNNQLSKFKMEVNP